MRNKTLAVSMLAATLLLSSCFWDKDEVPKTLENSTSTKTDTVAQKQADAKTEVKNGNTIAVDYVGRLEDGTIFDSSIQEQAKKSKSYNENRSYAPLVFTVGAGQMIRGFDKGVVGLKVGEKKTLTIAPEDAYGTGGTETKVDRRAIESNFTQTIERSRYADKVPVTIPKKTFDEQNKSVAVGQTITAGGVTAKVLKMDDTNVYLEIDNKSNPFYGKTLKVGLTGEFEGNTVTISKLDAKNVTLKVENKSNPFYGKILKKGLEGMYQDERIVIKELDKDSATLERIPALAGKTLIFDVEIKEIK